MKYHFRIKEDWLELILALMLIYVSVSAIMRGYWFVVLVVSIFLVGTVYLWWKQAKVRWCIECQKPMQRILVGAQDDETIFYICGVCGKRNDSGIQRSYPE